MEDYIVIAKNIFKIVINYILPIASFFFSVFVFVKSRKINKLEEKIKQYELDKIEQEKRIEKRQILKQKLRE